MTHGQDLIALAVGMVSADDISVEPVQASKWHKVQEAAKDGRLFTESGAKSVDNDVLGYFDESHPFMIRHDWIAAMGEAFDPHEVGNDFPLPFPMCAFEFRVNGFHVVLWVLQPEGHETTMTAFAQVGGDWVNPPVTGHEDYAVIQRCWDQVRAACVALDAGVAVTIEGASPPEKLNAKRLRNGRPQMKALHVIDLAKRHRQGARGDGDLARKRLHFRRGHWRHYENTKTWVKWCLVGDPSLGFVDHHYRL